MSTCKTGTRLWLYLLACVVVRTVPAVHFSVSVNGKLWRASRCSILQHAPDSITRVFMQTVLRMGLKLHLLAERRAQFSLHILFYWEMHVNKLRMNDMLRKLSCKSYSVCVFNWNEAICCLQGAQCDQSYDGTESDWEMDVNKFFTVRSFSLRVIVQIILRMSLHWHLTLLIRAGFISLIWDT